MHDTVTEGTWWNVNRSHTYTRKMFGDYYVNDVSSDNVLFL